MRKIAWYFGDGVPLPLPPTTFNYACVTKLELGIGTGGNGIVRNIRGNLYNNINNNNNNIAHNVYVAVIMT